jgi:hypothetical protein
LRSSGAGLCAPAARSQRLDLRSSRLHLSLDYARSKISESQEGNTRRPPRQGGVTLPHEAEAARRASAHRVMPHRLWALTPLVEYLALRAIAVGLTDLRNESAARHHGMHPRHRPPVKFRNRVAVLGFNVLSQDTDRHAGWVAGLRVGGGEDIILGVLKCCGIYLHHLQVGIPAQRTTIDLRLAYPPRFSWTRLRT